jgi:ribosomal protein L3 glutamine methyltransferase
MMDPIADELRTLRDFVRWGASRFNEARLTFGHGTDNAIDEAITLVLHALHLQPGLPDTLWKAHLTTPEKHAILNLLRKRVEKRLPAAYLTHQAWFAGLPFYVDERVLIPRSPLAELIQRGFSPWLEADQVGAVLDLCTGSGCIAIACALHLPHAQVDAADISGEALEVARRNIANYHLEERVQAVQSDLFTQLADRGYDLIVSNPPYVDTLTLADLPTEYQHEPALGLAAGEDGLDVARRILATAPRHLNPGGILIVEVGASQDALAEAYPEVEFLWLDFERGGDGVFLLTAAQLAEYAELFQERAGG